MPAKYTAMDIAQWFLNRVDRNSGDSITHLKLQKLIYYAQAWYLANHPSPLFDEDLQAWAHGPVAPSVWKKFQRHGWEALDAISGHSRLDDKTAGFLEQVYAAYGADSAKNLEGFTHAEQPWIEARGNLPPEAKCTTVISKKTMRDYYRKRLDAARANS